MSKQRTHRSLITTFELFECMQDALGNNNNNNNKAAPCERAARTQRAHVGQHKGAPSARARA